MSEMEQHRKFMHEAIQLAAHNVHSSNGGPFGAVVVKDGQVIGKGTNLVTRDNDPTAHAEIMAIRDACATLETFDLDGCELYSSCEPCPMCLGSLYWANISKLYYASTKEDAAKANFDDSHIYEQFSLPKQERRIPSIQLMREESVMVFETWLASEDKIPY